MYIDRHFILPPKEILIIGNQPQIKVTNIAGGVGVTQVDPNMPQIYDKGGCL